MNVKKTAQYFLLAGLLCGCGTFQVKEQSDAERLTSLARITSFTGSALYLSRNPQDLPAFMLARSGVEALLGGGEISPVALREALAQLPMSELRADRAAILITTALLMVEEVGIAEPVEGSSSAKALALGVRDGLDLAIKLTQAGGPTITK